ncbi:ATP-binding protein [uncultured Desulfosarcina sp.]|uniref:ATP-binding protein n=1 Tax=uncultured Desulfosarcina sp. TaxID=218289 RepID=UPI0029C94C5E|nr:ATP-binding protein [uncultured Desulfosarcina sp.]
MLDRIIENELKTTADEYPVITIIGPRQSGKTTLARKLFQHHAYVNLENPELRSLALDDPKTFMLRYPAPVVFDEIQNVPELLSWVQVAVDEKPELTGGYILTGSHQLQLREAITQSLAGRTALLTLFPFALNELEKEYTQMERETLIHNGFMPRLHDKNIRPGRFYRDYFQTYVERDVRKLMAIENQQAFELFLKLLAGRIGHEINYSGLAGQVGISAPQIKKWLSLLEASFIIFRLPPFFNNFGKRMTKSPKIYFVEVGLACYLLGIENPEQLERDPAFGGLFENMVIAEAYKSRINAGLEPGLYFYRDRYQHEIDLLYPSGSFFIPIEIKSSRVYRGEFLKGIRYFQKLSGSKQSGMLVYDGDLEVDREDAVIRNFRNAWRI